MHRYLFSCLFLIECLALNSAPAQTSQVPAPTPPLVAPVPDKADWSIITSETSLSQPLPGAPKKVRITEAHTTKSGALRHNQLFWTDNTIGENWTMEAYTFWTRPNGKLEASVLFGLRPEHPCVTTGYPGVGWISLANYKDYVKYNSKLCYHYDDGIMQAWIDIKTGLPVAYMSGKDVYTFKFNAPPAGTLKLPSQYEAIWQRIQKLQVAQQTDPPKPQPATGQ